MDLRAQGRTVHPCIGVSSECIHLCPIFESLDAELSGKRAIHIAKKLRFPHFFEGCVLLRKCVCVNSFPFELNNMGLEGEKVLGKLSPSYKSSAPGRPHGTHGFWQQQVCVLFTHIILAGECNVSFYFLFFW